MTQLYGIIKRFDDVYLLHCSIKAFMIFLWFTACELIVEQALMDDVAKICDGRENTRTRNENRKMTMTFVEKHRHAILERTRCELRAASITYRVINAPHKHTEQRLVRTEQLNLLVLHPEVLLL